MRPLAIHASGMVTGVGMSSPATCAAIRCAIDNFRETPFPDGWGEPLIGSQVFFHDVVPGLRKLALMALSALNECLASISHVSLDRIALLLCVAEKERFGRQAGLDTMLYKRIETELGQSFHQSSGTFPGGHTGFAHALVKANSLLHEEGVRYCVILGVDSLLDAAILAGYERSHRLLTSKNSDGFIPGEAACAIVVSGLQEVGSASLLCTGLGFGYEQATVRSDLPLRADGLVQALRSACLDAGKTMADMDFRVTDANGEQYGFKESSLAVSRTLRTRKERFEIWHAADSIGEIGAAIGPCAVGVILTAMQKRYAPGSVALCHLGESSGERAALIFERACGYA